ncbi:MAG TPA: MBL fold metallo-hydrolase [Thermoleophilaceae bacterium]|nr:MBL fold metallo-hydrolase [Thermoleophilaceae bacterium]
MTGPGRRRELARADRVMAGLWRLRLPLPWPGVPHVNAFAIASGSGVVLVDTGLAEPGALGELERALGQAGLRLEHVRLLVCTHAHADHYGLAAPILRAAGCELWMHPNHAHTTKAAQDPDRMLERRIEVARHSGVPADALERYDASRRGRGMGVAEVVPPDRDLGPGVEVDTDLGVWQVHEAPGHAPSHVVLHQPDRRLLLSGDHLLGRISHYYDYGYTPDPAGEFLSSLDMVERLGAQLCLAGHGRPFREVGAKVQANREVVAEHLDLVRSMLRAGPCTPFEVVPALVGSEDLSPMVVSWGLSQALSYLRHLEVREEARRLEGEDPERWELA